MADFKGTWNVHEVHVQKGHGDHMPQVGRVIRIVEEEAVYVLTFDDGAKPIRVPKDDVHPDHLHLKRPQSEEGYGLDFDCWSSGPVAGLMTGTVRYGRPGNEDNDTATFTATKTTWPERTE